MSLHPTPNTCAPAYTRMYIKCGKCSSICSHSGATKELVGSLYHSLWLFGLKVFLLIVLNNRLMLPDIRGNLLFSLWPFLIMWSGLYSEMVPKGGSTVLLLNLFVLNPFAFGSASYLTVLLSQGEEESTGSHPDKLINSAQYISQNNNTFSRGSCVSLSHIFIRKTDWRRY